jgi:hypothetical protein
MTENENEYQNEEDGLKIAIDEMKQNLTAQFAGIDSIKSSARTIFGAASLVISIISAFEIGKMRQSWYLLALLILYILLVIMCIYILSPVKMDLPVKSDWSEIYEFLMGDKIQVQRTWVYSYINTIRKNKIVLSIRSYLTILASILLAIIVILIILMSFFSRSPA